ncbi:ABC transporter ATP-binding protein [Terriglobus albidus]|uniref:ABC transporter ATP-binding protein n=1 Tax=Terriglobus albidus TaxID=1592106 RepID=UPI0021DFAA6E|nr:ABC transporter ATP-binding protein [Terriglobus albidus]
MSNRTPLSISLKGVVLSYTKGNPVLDIDSLEIFAGRRVFLYGPSGSGKTTLLSLISGILSPQEGEIHVLGHDLRRLSASERDILRGCEMGYIFQSFNLIPYLSVEENIALPCMFHASRRRRIRADSLSEEIRRIAKRLDIQDKLNAPIYELSTGQQQRVAIARAIIGSPPLVVADEPTSSLDNDRRDSFLDLLTEVVAETGSTLLFVSHDLTLTKHFEQSLSLTSINRRNAGTFL